MLDRETLEAEALKEVCACLYYDLADYLDSTSDDELRAIIEHKVKCDICGE
jgi:redox-regulated HSP33 family molecular chaperone